MLPFSEEKLATIGEVHQYRPYLIIGRSEDTAYAFSCSTSNHKTRYKVHVSKRDIFDKSTFIYTGKIYMLQAKHIVSLIGTLSPVVLRKVKRMIPFSSNSLGYFDSIPCGCTKGDVIRYENAAYYVFVETESKLHLHAVVSDNVSGCCVPLPEYRTELAGNYIDADTEFQIPSDSCYEYITYTSDNFVKYVQNVKQQKARIK